MYFYMHGIFLILKGLSNDMHLCICYINAFDPVYLQIKITDMSLLMFFLYFLKMISRTYLKEKQELVHHLLSDHTDCKWPLLNQVKILSI